MACLPGMHRYSRMRIKKKVNKYYVCVLWCCVGGLSHARGRVPLGTFRRVAQELLPPSVDTLFG